MSFVWAPMLWLVPVVASSLVVLYLWVRKRRHAALRFSDLGRIKTARGAGQAWRAHLPPLLLLLAICALLLALARPTAPIELLTQRTHVIMAIDVSLSMRANDIMPDRISVAQAASHTFINAQPKHVQLGLVTFAASAQLVQKPTRDSAALHQAIDRLTLQLGTATGSGMLVALAALFPEASGEIDALNFGRVTIGERAVSPSYRDEPASAPVSPVPPGSNNTALVILLSDGRRTTGPDPIDVARKFAERGVRVYTIGFGNFDSMRADDSDWAVHLKPDEESLKAVAAMTQAKYFRASDQQQLTKIYEGLGEQLIAEKKDVELGALFSAAAALLTVLAVGLSVRWFGRSA